MPYFKNDDINLLFIHIPKTGGSSLELYFSSKFNVQLNNKSVYNFIDDERLLNENMKINVSLHHITYNQIFKYSKIFNINFDNIKIITIVRNPYERIMSDLFYFGLIPTDATKETVFDIINEYLVSENYDNHNIPQHNFIMNDKGEMVQNIHILKTESLTNDMNNLGYSDFNIFENKNIHKVNSYYDYLNKNSIDIINKFYHLDFILFNYDKIESEF
jgi:hypothetical protein